MAKGQRGPTTVVIALQDDGTALPDPAYASKGDSIVWVSLGGDMQMSFPNDTPFDPAVGKKQSCKAHGKSNALRVTKDAPATFKYDLTTPTGTYDPVIIIDG